ncbi:hypothetical protein [Allonocardiopsis opalescens]|uniref:Uncharacterized protein n=1 Tax=Allonocardiopsis opalescens TaxID=1144618 RepID=A0A2T0PT12_9ACTN|nr:hypothetical protein [Allonocardiopsis opalescens]PRX92032.1 hypothetical protein CLV72_112105 [Allonocardiopsis opalescens]
MPAPAYYMLTVATSHAPGDTIPDDGEWSPAAVYTDDPRKLEASELLGGDGDLVDIVNGVVHPQILRVTPTGPVRLHSDYYKNTDGAPEFGDLLEAERWTVAAVEPLAALLGPQADHITAAIRLGFPAIDGDSPTALAYAAAVDHHWERVGAPAVHDAEEAARIALRHAGVDDYWWAHSGCVGGSELMALAARDLIGSTPAWTQDAYDLLTSPWRASVGPLHPDDAPLTVTAH